MQPDIIALLPGARLMDALEMLRIEFKISIVLNHFKVVTYILQDWRVQKSI